MDFKLLTVGTAAVLSSACPPLPVEEPTPTESAPILLPCGTDAYVIQGWDMPIACDLTPPQMLVIRIDDTQRDYDRCHHAGGTIMHDDEIPATYCLDIDY